MLRTAPVIALAALAALPSLASAESREHKKCRMLFANVSNNAPKSSRVDDNFRTRLANAETFYKKGKACVARFGNTPRIAAERAKGEKAVAAARDKMRHATESSKLRAEMKRLSDQIWADKIRDKKAVAAVAAAKARLDRLAKSNPLIARNRFGSELRALDRAIDQQRTRLEKKAIADHHQALREVAVVKRLAGFTPADSLDLDKVRAAFAKSGPTEIVWTRSKANSGRALYWNPSWMSGQSRLAHHNTWTQTMRMDKTKPLYGGAIGWKRATFLKVYYADHQPGNPPRGTIGLIWNVINKRDVVFVTTDGGRYTGTIDAFGLNLPAEESWAPAMAHQLLLEKDIEKLGAAGQIPKKIASGFAKAREAASKCGNRIWKRSTPKFDRLNRQNIRESVRRRRINQLNDKISRQVYRSCGKHERAFTRAFKLAHAHRVKQREATDKAVRDHLRAELGRLSRRP